MQRYRWPLLLLAGFLAGFLIFSGPVFAVEADSPTDFAFSALEGRAISILAGEKDLVTADLEVTDLAPKLFPLSGRTLYTVKVVDTSTGEIYSFVLDERGNKVDLGKARQTEDQAHDARLARLLVEVEEVSEEEAVERIQTSPHGRLTPDMFDLLEHMAPADPITVAVWMRSLGLAPLERVVFNPQGTEVESGDAPLELRSLPVLKPLASNEEETESGDSPSTAQVEAIRAEQQDLRREIKLTREERLYDLSLQVADLQAPLLWDLAAGGITPEYVSPLAPMVYVDLTKAEIVALVLRDDVDTIYGPNINQDYMNTAKPTQKADVVDNTFGFDGTGVDVAICEDSRIDWPHTYLSTGTTRVPGDTNVDNHVTACAGMVASLHPTYQGIAQGANLFSANGTTYSDANMSAAMDWAAITQNVDVHNNSWGGNDFSSAMNQHDRHLDYIVRHSACTATVAAGNEGADPSHYVGSPAKGYNVISVGVYNDNNTLAWDDDAMHSGSSYIDAISGEKPEVAASGTNITTTLMNNAMGTWGWGTSYAAPMVAGEAALLIDRSSTLGGWPEAVKAIIIATALHNLEGSSRISDVDGAGGVDMRAAFRVADENWWAARSVTGDSFIDQKITYTIGTLHAGQVFRAALAFDSNPNSSYTTDPLECDLDLRLYDSSDNLVASSAFGNQSWEIIEWTVDQTDTYKLVVFNYANSLTPAESTYIGVAWWPGHTVLSTAIQSYGTPPISRDYFQFSPISGYWNVVGVRSPQASSSYNYNIYLYDGSAFGDPADHNWLEDSTLSSVFVDYVVVDRNHAPAGDYHAEVNAVTGTGNYPIQFWTNVSVASDGTYTNIIEPYFLLRSYDVNFPANVRKYFAIKTTSGDADLGMSLHDSTVGTASTYYQGRSQRVAEADSAGAGGNETMNYETGTADDLALILWNNGATSQTAYKLYVDSSAPTGTITVDGGATYTRDTNVTLTLSATDSQTGVNQMHLGNTGQPYSPWEPYATSKSWTIPTGDGSKTVWVQFTNNAEMVSSQLNDSIILDTTAPTPNPMTWATAPYELNTTQLSMVATTATDTYTPVEYYHDYYDSPTGGSGGSDSGWITSTSFTDSGLQANHNYGYRVWARDPAGNSTSPSAISYDYTAIETPSGIAFGTITSSSIQARSTNTPSGLTRGSSGLIIYNTTQATNSGWKQNNDLWTSSGLSPNTSYTFQARARNGDASATPMSPTSSLYTLANVPIAAAFSNVTQTSIRANWTANGNPAGTWYYCENITAGTGSGWTTSTSWNSTGLSPDTSYSFRVRARNGQGVATGWISLGTQKTLLPADICECDLNGDHKCDMQDWLLFGTDWGRTDCGTPPGSGNPPNDCECDVNADGKCDMQDWLKFGEDWGRTDCP